MAAARGATAAKTASNAAIPQLAWNQIRPASVVLVSGTEGFLADRSIRLLRDLLRAEDPSLELSELTADTYVASELATVASPSLFGEPRFVRIDAVEKCSDIFLTEAISYLENPAEGATVVLRHAGGVRGKRLLDAIRAAQGTAIEVVCTELKKDAEKIDFVAAEFATAGRKARPDAIRALVSAFSGDLAELVAACTQLMADTTGAITEQTVAEYYGGRAEVSAFAVADLAIAGRTGEALLGLRQAINSGTDPVPMVAAFAMKMRTMAKVSSARVPSNQMARAFGLAPWQIDRAKRDLRGWNDAALGTCIRLIAETDGIVKGAGGDPLFALERMVTAIASRGRSLAR
ncbi:DNA polymerase III subunit delta [Mycetocola tolaasinivorans]|uniref:DNA-directed DNA polymerase n=1 Tax=Mycetocola tolaasinivorans TaxID=76635 RepID=A0A3L7A932_9MICO|nr:DNA polymerase III subunit delta [Mycetocola tolaasinivorans]RLP76863.1 DNA polymerase III subunit delta [Mycetocola tolaasinivorans]